MLHLEARISLWKFMKQLRKLLQCFLLLKCSKSWNFVDGTHIAIAWKGFSLPVLEAAPFSQAKADQKCFKFQNSLSNLSSMILPHSQTHEYTNKYNCSPTTKFVNMHFLLSNSVQDTVVKIHSLGKKIHIHTHSFVQFSWPKYIPMQKIMKLNLKCSIP